MEKILLLLLLLLVHAILENMAGTPFDGFPFAISCTTFRLVNFQMSWASFYIRGMAFLMMQFHS